MESANLMAPRLRELIQLIEQIRDGWYRHVNDQSLITKDLKSDEYHQLLQIVQSPNQRNLRDFCEAKLRYDYLPLKSLFVIHTIIPLREHVARSLDSLVINWLRGLGKSRKSSKGLAEAAMSICFAGAATVSLPGTTKRQPDNSYRHNKCKLPGLVMRVAWDEPLSSLKESAEGFICESRGSIRTVIGINLNEVYQARKKDDKGNASFFLWRAKFDRFGEYSGVEKSDDQIFQDRDGRTVTSMKLELAFQDFLCRKVADELGQENPRLQIPAAQLSETLHEGLQALEYPDGEDSEKEENACKDFQDPPSTPKSYGVRRSQRIQGRAAGAGLP
ncbi:hypothetical protein F5Y07DRAFT_409904 [Xylaria sp. FL0933]|nr:hypothetical protein F5Y07DRAFT_409904 [Xylaria sp. FL0933]